MALYVCPKCNNGGIHSDNCYLEMLEKPLCSTLRLKATKSIKSKIFQLTVSEEITSEVALCYALQGPNCWIHFCEKDACFVQELQEIGRNGAKP